MWRRLFVGLVILCVVLLVAGVALSAYNQRVYLTQQATKLWQRVIPPISPSPPSAMIEEGRVYQPIVVNEAPASPTPTPTPIDPYANDPDLKDAEWGKAVQVSETGWRMKVGFDATMSTAQEGFVALNHYRYTKGKSNLTWDDRLASYAHERASFICVNGSDGHAGFTRFVEDEEGYKKLGFYWLGENMSTHMRFTGTHLVEWMYAADPYHDGNQLGDWSHVGVGIYEDCSAFIFGNKMI